MLSMTPFERGINALLKLERLQCIRMHQGFTEQDRNTAYTDATNTRICVNTFAKAYLGDEKKFKKFEAAMAKAHEDVYTGSFMANVEAAGQFNAMVDTIKEVNDGS